MFFKMNINNSAIVNISPYKILKYIKNKNKEFKINCDNDIYIYLNYNFISK